MRARRCQSLARNVRVAVFLITLRMTAAYFALGVAPRLARALSPTPIVTNAPAMMIQP